jgi:hypothetical protein
MLLALEINVNYVALMALAPDLEPQYGPAAFQLRPLLRRLVSWLLVNALAAMEIQFNFVGGWDRPL